MLSRSSEYAIRALTYLAMQGADRFRLVRDMAQVLGIPAPFLAKVLQPLVAGGVLQSQRGRSGGFRLAHPPDQVRLLQIVDTQESVSKTHQCLLGQAVCTDEHPCPMHDYWRRASEAFIAQLENTTLQDLVDFCRSHANCSYPFQYFGEASGPTGAVPGHSAFGRGAGLSA
jgi:Rrf2 family protein